MDFLEAPDRPRKTKILRTRLYGDQEFTPFELEIIHTPIFQRLYNLKQLGFADRVFPDAVHSRFNHVLGVVEVVARMIQHLTRWLERSKQTLVYVDGESGPTTTITGSELALHIRQRSQQLRLMGLLHDLTHAAFGHTLEDEVNVFDEKHDDHHRQTRFFDALVGQLIYFWGTALRVHRFDAVELEELANLSLSENQQSELNLAQKIAGALDDTQRPLLAIKLRELEAAFVMLTHIEFAHGNDSPLPRPDLLAGKAAAMIDAAIPPFEVKLARDMFMIDLVGNTVCADLLDYARRDADNAGLRVQFDDRFLRYLCVVSVNGKLTPLERPTLRTGIQIFTDKMRHDVLSEMSGVLKARYLINERVLFHPTKCAAGAMLGTAVQLIGLHALPGWLQTLGDQEFVRTLQSAARNVERLCDSLGETLPIPQSKTWAEISNGVWPTNSDMGAVVTSAMERIVQASAPGNLTRELLEIASTRAKAARNVLWKLSSRRYPKLAYRLRYAKHTGGDSDETIAIRYSRSPARFDLERKIELTCNLPLGTVFIHCPRRKTSMKVAEAIVVGNDPSRASLLRDVVDVSEEGLEPYKGEIRSIESMYRSIWQFHAFLDPIYWHKQPLVEWVFERELGFPNDQLLKGELSDGNESIFHRLAVRLRDEIPPALLQELVLRVDAILDSGNVFPTDDDGLRTQVRKIVKEVIADSLLDLNSLDKQSKSRISQAQFRAGCREIFLKYVPDATGNKSLDTHLLAFISRNESRPPEVRHALLMKLREFDLSSDPAVVPAGVHRGGTAISERKLAEIERHVQESLIKK